MAPLSLAHLQQMGGKPSATYLWEDRGVVPFLKVDKGLDEEAIDSDEAGPEGEAQHTGDGGGPGFHCLEEKLIIRRGIGIARTQGCKVYSLRTV